MFGKSHGWDRIDCGEAEAALITADLWELVRKLGRRRTYIISTKRTTSGEELKERNGLEGLRLGGRDIIAPYPRRSEGQRCS